MENIVDVTCTNCRKPFFDIDWSNILSLLNKDKVALYLDENYVCNDCIDSKTGRCLRHNIIDKYIRIKNSGVRDINRFSIDNDNFEELLAFLRFYNREDFYGWFLKEASTHALLDHSVFNKICTPSPYPFSIGTLLQFIIYTYGNEFFEYILISWKNYTDKEKKNILKSIPIFSIQYDLDRVISCIR